MYLVMYEVLTTGTASVGYWNKLVLLKATRCAQNKFDNTCMLQDEKIWLLWRYLSNIRMRQHERLLDFTFPVRAETGKMTPFITHSKFMAWDFAAGPCTGILYQKTTKTQRLWKIYHLYCVYVLIQQLD